MYVVAKKYLGRNAFKNEVDYGAFHLSRQAENVTL